MSKSFFQKKGNVKAFILQYIRCLIFGIMIIVLANIVEGEHIWDLTELVVMMIVSLIMSFISGLVGKGN